MKAMIYRDGRIRHDSNVFVLYRQDEDVQVRSLGPFVNYEEAVATVYDRFPRVDWIGGYPLAPSLAA